MSTKTKKLKEVKIEEREYIKKKKLKNEKPVSKKNNLTKAEKTLVVKPNENIAVKLSPKSKKHKIGILIRFVRKISLSAGKYCFIFLYYLFKSLCSLLEFIVLSVRKFIRYQLQLVRTIFHRKKTPSDRRESVKDLHKSRFLNKRLRLIIILILLISLASFSTWLFWGLPLPTKLLESKVPVSTKLYDRNGELIYEIYADKRSSPVIVDELPEHVVEATIAIEDKDFYKHHGFSISGITRAAYNTLFKQKLQGGSTLTQQLVKNTLLTPERTIKRKLRELALTLIVEVLYSKQQILELYFNQIPYGSTAYGIGSASELYFNKNANDLSLAEAALLAGITAAPTKYSPFGVHPEIAKTRQEIVLNRMVEDGIITQEEADKAKAEKINLAEPQKFKAPHFALWVKELLADKYGDVMVEQGGLRVTTTLDLDLQEYAEATVSGELSKLKKQNVGNGAVLVTRPGSGEILAMVGSKDYYASDEDGKVNVIFANRQPGSSIKPINYALALKDKKITLSTPLADVPTCFSVYGQKQYCPVNYDGAFHGAVHPRFALGNSYNIPAVRVLALNGLENFIDFANDMGISTFIDPNNYGLSLTLGGGEVKPYDMATAFGVFANEGVKVPLNPILKVTDWKGKVYEEVNPDEVDGTRVIDPEVTFLISHTLLDNNSRSAAFGSSSYLVVKNHPEVSVKTGTTNDRKDNWTIGYTSHVLAVVWVGNNDNSEMSGAVSGVSGASPIWNTVIKYALDKAEKGLYNEEDDEHAWPEQPEGIVGRNVCTTTGNLPGSPDAPECPTRFEYFLKDAVGANIESGQKDVEVFKDTRQLANEEALPEQKEVQNHPFLIDPLGTLVCLDCPIASSSARISYPLTAVPR
ncbi:MAG: Penicillin-binding protein, 1A family [Candidatus Woesebacteria bacterium GW2011_GWB1_38_5]|uniref:Penicillin-binding protein, 1A family n=4 Tax=Candidatus Woeseibacteriota TaxID=1752722 RepID=A0A0G0N926_9BACT|nr:MAG: Penicillin-binding protein, 1A family [Candidatus Woesebacteria bacterium GW2011_GWC1_38_13]KKQ73591.1 MAG: Penicillin-binding protein, 1A family [Candidatus Woesebacteria bacterium GW2011_GWB1_38_5]